jgi:hypothetical protein
MKFQTYVIGRRLPSGGEEYRRFSVPVELRDGKWLPAAQPHEDTDVSCQFDIGLDVFQFEMSPDSSCGALSDIPCPRGWRVVSRFWLQDDYVPPTREELLEEDREVLRRLRAMGVIDP